MKRKKLIITASLLLMGFGVFAQEEVPVDSLKMLEKRTENLEAVMKQIQKLKVSGYIQTQFQYAEPYGSLKVGSGNTNYDENFSRIGIRRGRIKFTYEEKYASGVFQLDITEKGVGFKDAYILGKDPWFGSGSSLKLGVFDRPFGYEISYSSSQRESPERATVFQTLFPDERDLGGMLTLQMPKTSPLSILKLEGGFFAGNGIKLDMDNRKDFIGHLSAGNTIGSLAKWGAGFSYYNGGVYNPTKYTYNMEGANFICDSSGKLGNYAKREYFGIDGQFSIDWLLGVTTIRAEYLWGTQPGSSGSTKSPNYASMVDSPYLAGGIYNRSFNGYYVYLIQDIGSTPFTIVLKYDYYDPNTKISGNEIKAAGSNTSVADLACSTFGFGALWKMSKYLRLQAYYEINRNETSANTEVAVDKRKEPAADSKDYSSVRKANVFTLRLQYKF